MAIPLSSVPCLQRKTQVGALVLGSVLPNGKHSFPTSPTWMLYSDDSHSCVENVPVLTTQQTFCAAFLAEARVFRCVAPV